MSVVIPRSSQPSTIEARDNIIDAFKGLMDAGKLKKEDFLKVVEMHNLLVQNKIDPNDPLRVALSLARKAHPDFFSGAIDAALATAKEGKSPLNDLEDQLWFIKKHG